jgi:hypothetical protein
MDNYVKIQKLVGYNQTPIQIPIDQFESELEKSRLASATAVGTDIFQFVDAKGRTHRTDGPAWYRVWRGRVDGDYCLNGVPTKKGDWARRTGKNVPGNYVKIILKMGDNEQEISEEEVMIYMMDADTDFDEIEYRDAQNLPHRTDGPAVLSQDGKSWKIHGKYQIRENGEHNEERTGGKHARMWLSENGTLDRRDGPARIDDLGEYWYRRGFLHNENGPSIIKKDGTVEFYLNGKLHNEKGPARVSPDGKEEWYYNDARHRLDGFALIKKDRKEAYYCGMKHSETGPAVVFINSKGKEIQKYYLFGEQYKKAEWEKKIKEIQERKREIE